MDKVTLIKIQALPEIDLNSVRTPDGGVIVGYSRSVEQDNDKPFSYEKTKDPITGEELGIGGPVVFESPTKAMIGGITFCVFDFPSDYSLALNKDYTLKKEEYPDFYKYLKDMSAIAELAEGFKNLWEDIDEDTFLLKKQTNEELAVGLNYGVPAKPFTKYPSKLAHHNHYSTTNTGVPAETPSFNSWSLYCSNTTYKIRGYRIINQTNGTAYSGDSVTPGRQVSIGDSYTNLNSVSENIPLGDKNLAKRTVLIPRIRVK